MWCLVIPLPFRRTLFKNCVTTNKHVRIVFFSSRCAHLFTNYIYIGRKVKEIVILLQASLMSPLKTRTRIIVRMRTLIWRLTTFVWVINYI